MSFRVSHAAQSDLLEIFLYWAERASLRVADRIIERITARFRIIGEHPSAGKSVPDIVANVRCFPAGKYLIYYRKAGRFVDILHIFHGARDQAAAYLTK